MTSTDDSMLNERHHTDAKVTRMSIVVDGIAIDFGLSAKGKITGFWFPQGIAGGGFERETTAAIAYMQGWNDAKAAKP